MSEYYVKSIYIDKFRCFKEFSCKFNLGVNILVGPNGVGKSTILLVISYFVENDYDISALFYNQEFILGLELGISKLDRHLYEKLGLNTALLKYPGVLNLENIYNSVIDFATTSYRIPEPEKVWMAFPLNELEKKEISMFTFKTSNNAINIAAGNYYVIDNQLYFRSYIGEIVPMVVSDKYLNFNVEKNLKKYKEGIEENKSIKESFEKFRSRETEFFQKIASTKEMNFSYSTLPKMSVEIQNDKGVEINHLSSGQTQLQRLKFFVIAKEELNSKILTIDEPELHLNYGQQFYLSEFISRLSKNQSQVFIASHSPYFVTSVYFEHIKYIKLNMDGEPSVIELSKSNVRQYLSNPSVLYARKIIVVEGLADKLFYERMFNILLKNKYNTDLSSINIEVVAVYSKDAIKKTHKLLSENLMIDHVIITDFDFIHSDKNYSFLPPQQLSEIKDKLKGFVKLDIPKSIKRFKNMSDSLALEFLSFLDSIVRNNTIINESMSKRYKKYRNSFEVETFHSVSKKQGLLFRDVIKIFLQNNIWILSKGSLESYVNPILILDKKVNIDKIQQYFFPETIIDLKKLVKRGTLSELKDITKWVYSSLNDEL